MSKPHPLQSPGRAPSIALGALSSPQTQTRWQRLACKLQESEHRKSEFLAYLSRELRNPLAPISHGLQLLRKNPNQAELVQQTTAMMQRQLDRVIGMVDDLLDVQRIAQGKLELGLREVSLQELVQEALEACAPLLEEYGHRLTVHLPEAALWVRADPGRLTQVLSNLLVNAAKYTPSGGQVAVRGMARSEQAQLEIQDSGAGLAADELEHIFEPYAQVEQHQAMARGGLGLGLALARQLVELHGGQIRASSPGLGLGSTFSVTLPLCSPPIFSAATDTSKESTDSACWRILVVDDNCDGADTLAAALQCDGHQALAAYDGASALVQAKRWRPDAALVDLSMPGMDGFELARQLRQCAASAALVAMTGWGTATDRQRCEAAGFAAHIAKPASIDSIEAVLTQLLQGRKADPAADQRAERRNTC